MSEKDLNIEYICEKTLLNKDDELVPIILSLIQESYKAGLCQTEFDNTMNLIEENQELKKQLEKKQNPLQGIFSQVNDDMLLRDCGAMQFEIDEYKTQQKEFIEYMNKTIEELECDDVDDEEMKGYLIQRIDTFKEILSKYRSIIGGDKSE